MNYRICLNYASSVMAALLMLAAFSPAQAQSPATRESLVQMFANIEKGPKWKMSHDMLWGYFFTNQSRQPLESAAKALSKLGYRVVAIYLSDKDEPGEPDLWWLHVERVETHSIDSLHTRNNELATFAKKLGLTSYDGMDVGPVSGSPK
jgi:hypothetical protein